MIERGKNDKLHTRGCSAAHHHRTTNLGLFCQFRLVWVIVPTRVKTALFVLLLVALTLVASWAVDYLFGGIV